MPYFNYSPSPSLSLFLVKHFGSYVVPSLDILRAPVKTPEKTTLLTIRLCLFIGRVRWRRYGLLRGRWLHLGSHYGSLGACHYRGVQHSFWVLPGRVLGRIGGTHPVNNGRLLTLPDRTCRHRCS